MSSILTLAADSLLISTFQQGEDVNRIVKAIKGIETNSILIFVSPALLNKELAESLPKTISAIILWQTANKAICEVEYKGRQGRINKLVVFSLKYKSQNHLQPHLGALEASLEEYLNLDNKHA